MLMAELKELGMEEDDIEDLVDLSEMMYKFVSIFILFKSSCTTG